MTQGEDLERSDYSGPTRSCDIVMKGGITSGVVYPHAVCELAPTYRFRNVGGTSAGAIAAAATAAAEYGRTSGGFNRLAGLPAWIGADRNLQNLFQPQPGTKGLFAVLIAALEGGAWKAIGMAIRKNAVAFVAGAVPGLALLAVAVARGVGHGFEPVAVLAALSGLVLIGIGSTAAIAARVALQILRAIPDNKYGLCSGGPSSKPGGPPSLTPWLAGLLDKLAGSLPKGEPLTFGHLWAGPGKDREDLPADPDDRYLQLAMMTTNLVNRRAHQLPWDNREWLFDPSEFRELFPEEVVKWMEDHPPEPRANDPETVLASRVRRALVEPLLPLPAPADLPVVVATRMSLSFPILLGAVPLWRIDTTRPENEVLDEWRDWARRQDEAFDPLTTDPAKWPTDGQPDSRPLAERCWFSDGGISSNFPVHFFDRLIPRWPTFAINLRPFALGQKPDHADQAKNTWMVKTNSDGIRDWWYRFPERPGGIGFADRRLVGFLSSAIRTMQNRVDEAQMRVPGYRDRIAHVSMSDDEGGMNLTMPAETIAALTARGRAAAGLLHDAYTPPDDGQVITWDNHRWVRLRSSLSVLEEMHDHFADGYSKDPESTAERTYEHLLNRPSGEAPDSYRWADDVQRQLASVEIQAILDAAKASGPADSVSRKAPRPSPQGRIAPRD